MTDYMLGPSPIHIKYVSYVYDIFCIWRTNFPGPIESVISKFACIMTSRAPVHSTGLVQNPTLHPHLHNNVFVIVIPLTNHIDLNAVVSMQLHSYYAYQ